MLMPKLTIWIKLTRLGQNENTNNTIKYLISEVLE